MVFHLLQLCPGERWKPLVQIATAYSRAKFMNYLTVVGFGQVDSTTQDAALTLYQSL